MARRAAPNEDRTRVTLTWVFSRSDLATVSGATGSIPSLFTQGLVLPRTPLSWKHTKRAGVHSISGGMYTLPPYGSIRSFLGRVCHVSPDFACTLARFVCMYSVRIGEYFEVFWQGFSEIVLQIPLDISTFRGAYPAGGEGVA